MTDWDRILEFYNTAAQRANPEYAEFGARMLALVTQLKNSPQLAHVQVDTAMYNLMLWIGELKGQYLHITWHNNHYKLSLMLSEPNAHEASSIKPISEHEVSSEEVMTVINDCLRQMQDDMSNV
jgi:hypothetical protein